MWDDVRKEELAIPCAAYERGGRSEPVAGPGAPASLPRDLSPQPFDGRVARPDGVPRDHVVLTCPGVDFEEIERRGVSPAAGPTGGVRPARVSGPRRHGRQPAKVEGPERVVDGVRAICDFASTVGCPV